MLRLRYNAGNSFMKLGIILQSNKPEHVWNTFRLGITALKAGHRAEIFLMSEGSELDTVPDSKDFDISARVTEFKALKGEIYACGSCLKIRGKEGSNVCPVSTMSDLLTMVESSDKVLVFG
ncbi:MAG: DsrE family protein [Candidatus Giovannonibacteria bacterium GW2011_GWA2_53_7]|uniref:DsrE family protein n=1 Tax=Candidatus Giovannonibacteria bacterium GW2011_GWA2_53_7 TaxID=1618650 RepID=A0A0G2A1E6_9BACT|nr:MAG: DsrE family protein [Candidatus Giovannonibacteria bacterium GW2011_GWA2_53_7]